MAKDKNIKVTKQVKWPEVVSKTASTFGVPKKQIEETINQVSDTLMKLFEETRPQKVGTATTIITPLVSYRTTRIPAETRRDVTTGKEIEREEVIAMSVVVPHKFIDAANIGLVLDKNETKEKSKEKSA